LRRVVAREARGGDRRVDQRRASSRRGASIDCVEAEVHSVVGARRVVGRCAERGRQGACGHPTVQPAGHHAVGQRCVVLLEEVVAAWQVAGLAVLQDTRKVTCQKPSVAESACQLKFVVRLAEPWIAWMKLVESADHPLLVRFGLWYHEHVVASLRWPPWNASVVKAPSSWWHLLQRASSTMSRRPVYPVATFCRVGAITIRPPISLAWPIG